MWRCVCRVNPTADYNFDGITLGPYDLLFVKFKDTLLHSMSKSPEIALRYGSWMESQVDLLSSGIPRSRGSLDVELEFKLAGVSLSPQGFEP